MSGEMLICRHRAIWCGSTRTRTIATSRDWATNTEYHISTTFKAVRCSFHNPTILLQHTRYPSPFRNCRRQYINNTTDRYPPRRRNQRDFHKWNESPQRSQEICPCHVRESRTRKGCSKQCIFIATPLNYGESFGVVVILCYSSCRIRDGRERDTSMDGGMMMKSGIDLDM